MVHPLVAEKGLPRDFLVGLDALLLILRGGLPLILSHEVGLVYVDARGLGLDGLLDGTEVGVLAIRALAMDLNGGCSRQLTHGEQHDEILFQMNGEAVWDDVASVALVLVDEQETLDGGHL